MAEGRESRAENQEYSDPLTSRQVERLESLPPEEEPPAELTINLSTFRVPEETQANVVKVEDSSDIFQLQVTLPRDAIQRRVLENATERHVPYDHIPAIPVDRSQITDREAQAVSHDGMRPRYLPVKPLPQAVEPLVTELARPPADFEYKEGIDRPTNVFAPDNRNVYQDTSFPWSTIGRVDSPLGFCTGCTIGPQLLLTGSHCIQWNADGTTGWVRFRPAYYNGFAPFGEAWATQTLFWVRTTGGDGLSDQETAFDYVVCVLNTRIGDTIGYAGARTYDSSWNGGNYWQHMGYPSDLTGGERPTFQAGAAVSSTSSESSAEQTGYVLGHFNDVVGGHSGGPVWGWWSNEDSPRVVGTQSAEANVPAPNTSGDNEFGGGPALTSLISWARSNFP